MRDASRSPMGANMTHTPQRRRHGRGQFAPATSVNGVPVAVDLLRADLYRMLDEIARAGHESHPALVAQFERAWERFKDATRARG